jgi:NAD(P)-dependent dehydrogenase (short-subunit alcohol dehydrogenase family)
MNAKDGQVLAVAAGIGALLGIRALLRQRQEYDFRGKTVLITGGARGLGLVMAREFAAHGAHLVICSRNAEELERGRADLAQRSAQVLAVPCDVGDREQVERLVEAARDRFGRVDVLVNNAGVIQAGPMEVQTVEDFEEAMRVHFWGPVYTTLAVAPEMQRRREGRIVNVSSIGGRISMPHLLPYNASKFALVGYSEGLRAELAKDGVAVTTVLPGLMRTGSPRNAMFKGQHQAEYAWFTLSDSLPGSSVSAESAARQIVSVCRRGAAELVISVPAKAAVLFHGVVPGLTADLLGVVNRMLPGPGGIGTERALGKDSETPLTRSWLTTLTQRAARANNEMP